MSLDRIAELVPAWADDVLIVTGAISWSCAALIVVAAAASSAHKGLREARGRLGARRLVKGAEALTREAATR